MDRNTYCSNSNGQAAQAVKQEIFKYFLIKSFNRKEMILWPVNNPNAFRLIWSASIELLATFILGQHTKDLRKSQSCIHCVSIYSINLGINGI